MRILRRRLGLSQRELAFLLGYDSDSQVSRLEDGSRIPNLFEALMLELVFEMGTTLIFELLHQRARQSLIQRIEALKAGLVASSSRHRRVSYKTAQLDRLLVLLQAKEDPI